MRLLAKPQRPRVIWGHGTGDRLSAIVYRIVSRRFPTALAVDAPVQFILFLAHLFIEPDIFIDRHVVYYTLVLTFTNAKFNEMIPVNMKMMSKPIMLKYDSVDL